MYMQVIDNYRKALLLSPHAPGITNSGVIPLKALFSLIKRGIDVYITRTR